MLENNQYYDVVLASIPLALLITPLLLWGFGFQPAIAKIVGSALAMTLIFHALFIRGPQSENELQQTIRKTPNTDKTKP